MSGFSETPKQREIMRHICGATSRGEELTMMELHGKLSYGKTASRQSVQCSINFLQKHGFLVKKHRGSKSMLLMPTELAMRRFRIIS